MCLLCYMPEDIVPDYDQLEIASANNPDGFGYAIVTAAGNMLIRRSMNPDYLLERFTRDRRRHRRGPALFHARIGTSGTKTLSNCHPFRLGRDGRTVLAHNGSLFRPPASDPRSDTHIFAREIMPVNYRTVDRPEVRRRLEKQIGFNKIVLLTTNRRFRHRSYIFNETLGHWNPDGVWMSNGSYRELRRATNYYAGPVPQTRWTNGVMERSYDGGNTWYETVTGRGTNNTVVMNPARKGTRYGYCRWCRLPQVVEPYTKICSVCRACNECGKWSRACKCELVLAG